MRRCIYFHPIATSNSKFLMFICLIFQFEVDPDPVMFKRKREIEAMEHRRHSYSVPATSSLQHISSSVQPCDSATSYKLKVRYRHVLSSISNFFDVWCSRNKILRVLDLQLPPLLFKQTGFYHSSMFVYIFHSTKPYSFLV